jgi:hypothetical protein
VKEGNMALQPKNCKGPYKTDDEIACEFERLFDAFLDTCYDKFDVKPVDVYIERDIHKLTPSIMKRLKACYFGWNMEIVTVNDLKYMRFLPNEKIQ